MSRATLRIAIAALVTSLVILAGAAAWLISTMDARAPNSGGGSVANVQLGGPFTLTDQTGRRVSDGGFRSRFMLIFFGYASCPDVCPTELATMAAALDMLGDQSERIVPIFITVDPERDTQETLAGYVPMFHERLIGLTGTKEEIAAVAKAYSVFYQRVDNGGAIDYLMEHTTFIYLMAPDGEFAEIFRFGTSPAEIANAIRDRLSSAVAG